jgi:hypothetical protein
MPRGKRTNHVTDDTKAPARKGCRRKKAQEASKAPRANHRGADPESKLATAEAELRAKYPELKIKAGSLLPAGAAEFGNKRTVVILCADCEAERRVATSDLFHVSRCVECTKKARSKKGKPKGSDA